MTRQSGDQPTRRLTVAELLAQHGKADGGTRHRHRRRAAEDEDEGAADLTTTAPQEIIDRIHAERPEDEWPTRRTNGHSLPGQPTVAPPREQAVPPPPAPPPVTSPPPKPTIRPRGWTPAEPVTPPRRKPMQREQPPPRQQPPREQPGKPAAGTEIDDRLNGSRRQLSPVVPPPPPPPRRPQSAREQLTDEFAAVADEVSEVDGYNFAEPEADLDDAHAESSAVENETDEPSPGKQWLAVGAQLALGVVGGAAVWLAFNWMWMWLPAIALAAALIVTAGLVWIVRNIRKAEDLQSTVLAVLVGLVVTVSPAALLLLSNQ